MPATTQTPEASATARAFRHRLPPSPDFLAGLSKLNVNKLRELCNVMQKMQAGRLQPPAKSSGGKSFTLSEPALRRCRRVPVSRGSFAGRFFAEDCNAVLTRN